MTSIPVTIIGVMTYTDVGVGGGPMPGGPEVSHPIAPGGPPPGIWPTPGYPAHPIAPGGPPPGIWPSPGVPTHPIVIPVPPNGGEGNSPTHPIVIPPGEPIDPAKQGVLVHVYVPQVNKAVWFYIQEPQRPPPTTPEPKPE